jgi:hypothetical protein
MDPNGQSDPLYERGGSLKRHDGSIPGKYSNIAFVVDEKSIDAMDLLSLLMKFTYKVYL